MTRADLREKIKRKLGAPTVKVELTSAALNDAINDAVLVARKYGYGTALKRRYYVLQLSAGVSAYTLPSGTNTIEEYVFPGADHLDGINVLFTWQNLYFGGPWAWHPADAADLVGYHNFLSYIETWKKYSINKFRLQLDQPAGRVFCQPTPVAADLTTSGSGIVLLTIWTDYDETVIFNNIDVQKLSIGYAKQTLAHIRGKYSGYALPGAQGGSLNADTLASEAEKEIEEAITQLKEEGEGLGFLLG
jgi:hypothetical protein